MNSGFRCDRCHTTYGIYIGRDEYRRAEHYRRIHECAAGRCPGWRRILWRVLRRLTRGR